MTSSQDSSISDRACRHDKMAPIVLWAQNAPGALGQGEQDIPTITPYLPDPRLATGAAMVICPGGGYLELAAYEGQDYALWLNLHGVAGFVLKYRLGSAGYRYPCMLQDAARAVRTVRSRAAEWGVDARRIGIMGSSAGGHLAAMLLTKFDAGQPDAADPIERQSSRPDLGVLCYAVVTMGEFTHKLTRDNLIGAAPKPELLLALSNELHVTPQTPACFLWQTLQDGLVKAENILAFGAALRRNGVPFDLHIYQNGRHGIGLGDTSPFAQPHPWTHALTFWLQAQGFVK